MRERLLGGLGKRAVLRVSKNALARLSSQTGARLLAIVLAGLVARYEGAAGLGRYVLVVTLVSITGVVSDLGLNTLLIRDAARQPDPARQRALLGLVLPLKGGLALLGFAGLLAIMALLPFPAQTKRLMPVGALALLPDALSGAMAALVNARRRMEVSGGVTLLTRSLGLAGAFPLLALGYGLAGVLVWAAAVSLLGLGLYGWVLCRWGLLPRCRWDPAAWRACLFESYPFALTSILASLYARLDLILLSLWQGEMAAGWYGAAYKLWEAAGLLWASLLDALFPEMSRLAVGQAGRQRLRTLFRLGQRGVLAAGVLLALAGVLSAQFLIPLVYGGGEDYSPAVLIFRLMVWAIPAMFLYLLCGHVLYALGEQRRVARAILAVGLANLALNLLVIPRWSYRGAAVVTLFSEWLLLLLLYPRTRQTLAVTNDANKRMSQIPSE